MYKSKELNQCFAKNVSYICFPSIKQNNVIPHVCSLRMYTLPIKKGPWLNIDRNRECNLCHLNDIGDEFHYVFNFSNIDNAGKQLKQKMYKQYVVKGHE